MKHNNRDNNGKFMKKVNVPDFTNYPKLNIGDKVNYKQQLEIGMIVDVTQDFDVCVDAVISIEDNKYFACSNDINFYGVIATNRMGKKYSWLLANEIEYKPIYKTVFKGWAEGYGPKVEPKVEDVKRDEIIKTAILKMIDDKMLDDKAFVSKNPFKVGDKCLKGEVEGLVDLVRQDFCYVRLWDSCSSDWIPYEQLTKIEKPIEHKYKVNDIVLARGKVWIIDRLIGDTMYGIKSIEKGITGIFDESSIDKKIGTVS